MSDTNFKSFNGPQDNGRSVVLDDVYLNPKTDWASALKFSTGLTDFTLVAGTVFGGHDACVDVNNLCSNIDITIRELIPNGQFGATIKGGSKNVTLRGELLTRGKMADVIYGDWSDQSHKKVTGSKLLIKTRDRLPARILVLKSERPEILPGSAEIEWLFPSPNLPFHDIAVYGFETLRRWGAFRKQAN